MTSQASGFLPCNMLSFPYFFVPDSTPGLHWLSESTTCNVFPRFSSFRFKSKARGCETFLPLLKRFKFALFNIGTISIPLRKYDLSCNKATLITVAVHHPVLLPTFNSTAAVSPTKRIAARVANYSSCILQNNRLVLIVFILRHATGPMYTFEAIVKLWIQLVWRQLILKNAKKFINCLTIEKATKLRNNIAVK